MGNKLYNFLLMWIWVCGARYFGMKKGLRNSEGLFIHDGGDEGDRTPDLLTASQALSQLSYAPMTRKYYRGMFCLMQGLFWPDSKCLLILDSHLHCNRLRTQRNALR